MASSAAPGPLRPSQPPSSSKPPKFPASNPLPEPSNPNPNPNLDPGSSSAGAAGSNPLALHPDAVALSRATHLTRPEVLRLRSRRMKQLARCYRDHYWALMEELKVQYRDYYWKYGVSPFKDTSDADAFASHRPEDHSGEDPHIQSHNGAATGGKNDAEANGNFPRCCILGCKLKAMALTNFCHPHILSDSKQQLYKPCGFVTKSSQSGPITCGKPILRSTSPSLCTNHSQRAQKPVIQALRKAGLSVASSTKLAPKFHVVVVECVKQIQAKRKAAGAGKASRKKVPVKEETTNPMRLASSDNENKSIIS